jgi:hypothetical protein
MRQFGTSRQVVCFRVVADLPVRSVVVDQLNFNVPPPALNISLSHLSTDDGSGVGNASITIELRRFARAVPCVRDADCTAWARCIASDRVRCIGSSRSPAVQ